MDGIAVDVAQVDGQQVEEESAVLLGVDGSLAFKEAMRKAKPVILEPVMKVVVITPEVSMGDIVGDINSKRGMIKEMGDRGEGAARVKEITAEVPLASILGCVW